MSVLSAVIAVQNVFGRLSSSDFGMSNGVVQCSPRQFVAGLVGSECGGRRLNRRSTCKLWLWRKHRNVQANHVSEVGAGRIPEFLEMMQTGVSDRSGSARLLGR